MPGLRGIGVNVRLYHRNVVVAKFIEIHRKIRSNDPSPMEILAYWSAASFAGRAASAFTLEYDPDETIWLVDIPRYATLEAVLAHESLHVALNRLGEKDASKAIDRYLFWTIRRSRMDDGGI